jgi:hypothetical protein
MTEATPDAVTAEDTTPAETETPAPTADDIKKLTAALEKERDLRKRYETSAKEAENARKASMTESERAVAEAEERGRLTAVTAYGQRLARTQYEAEAARRNPAYNVADVLDDLNLAKFLGEDGEPDSKAIAASVARLVPEADTAPRYGNADQGPRANPATGPDMNSFIRKATGRA